MTMTDPIISETSSELQSSAPRADKRRRLPGLRLALFAGALLWLAHPIATLWPLAWVAVVPLLLGVTRAVRFRQAFWRGYLFGWVYLGMIWYWTGLTIVAWTHSPIGWLAWFGLTLVLAGFYGFYGGFAWWLYRHTVGWTRILALAAAWVVMEWLRTLGSLTMPWAQISYTQYHFLPVLQIAEITGAYGVSFLIVMVNAALIEKGAGRMRRVGIALAVVALVCCYGVLRMAVPEKGAPLTVAAMQGNFRVTDDLDTMHTLQVFNDLTHQAATHAATPPVLYVWGESAAPRDAVHDYRTRCALAAVAQNYHAALLTGSRIEMPAPLPSQHPSDPGNDDTGPISRATETNSSVLFPPDGGIVTHYDKQQLVPFGEFIPFRESLPSLLDEKFGFPPNDVTPGADSVVLSFQNTHAGTVAIGPFICYESMYPAYARAMTRRGANLLVTQSNDDWFQSEAAMEQHLSAVVLRAIENRRDVVRATTTGITCILDSRGRVLARAPLDMPAFLVRTIHLETGKTFYTRFGDWFVALCGLFLASLLWREIRKARASKAE